MRVHHLINVLDERFGGAEKIALSLHQGLLARGHQSSLVAMTRSVRPDIEWCSDLGASSPYSPSIVGRIRQYLNVHCDDDDIVHAHLFPTTFFLSLARRTTGWKGVLVTTEHSTSNRRRKAWWGRQVDRMTYQPFDQIFCISDATAQSLHDWYPKLKARTQVIENGVALRFESPSVRESNRRVIQLVSIGRLHPVKDYETTIHAIDKLSKLTEPGTFLLRIAGEGPLRQALEQQVADLGLQQCVEFCGYVTDPSELLMDSDIFLITSKWEGFGLSAVEAMNATLPIVASDVSGLRDVVGTNGRCGRLVPAGDAAAVANELFQLMKSASLRHSMGQAAFAKSLAYSDDRMIDQHVAAYECLLSTSAGVIGHNSPMTA